MTLVFSFAINIADVIPGLGNNKAYAAVSATLSIGSPSVSGSAEPGGIAYAKSNVTYNVADTSGWSLRVSYASGKTALSASGGSSISGAGGKQGSSMTDNTWGYAWSDSTSATQSGLYYQTMPAYDSPTSMKSSTTATNGNVTGAINFAAKFATNAIPGHYSTNVLVSLVASPPLVTYTLSFNSNTTDTVTNLPGNQTCTTTTSNPESCNIAISNTKPTRTGYDFQGWSTSSGSSNTVTNAAGSSIAMTANRTLYAVWKANVQYTYTVTYDLVTTQTSDRCGDALNKPESFTITTADTAYEYTIPSVDVVNVMNLLKDNDKTYHFSGWSTTSYAVGSGTRNYTAGSKITLTPSTPSVTLYAVWSASTSGTLQPCTAPKPGV